MRIIILLLTTFLLFQLAELHAQLPATKMYLLEGDFSKSSWDIDKLQYLTEFNPTGYNNQPSWSSGSEIYFTSNHNALGLTDIYKIDLRTNRLTRITKTEESEYSPQLNADGNITVVRQELDDSPQVPQTLWSYPSTLTSYGTNLIPRRSDIGYYCMLPSRHVALFIVGDKSSLQILEMDDEDEEFIGYNVGRCMRNDQNGGLLYVQKLGSTWLLKRRVLDAGLTQTITPMLDDVEDIDILSDGNLIAGKGGVLYIYNMSTKDGWKEVIDLSSAGIRKITRIAANTDKLVIVSE